MAAISSLVLSDNIPPQDRAEELGTPTTPRAAHFGSSLRGVSPIAVLEPAHHTRPASSPTSRPSSQGTLQDAAEGHRGDSGDRRDDEEAMEMDDDDQDLQGSDLEDGDPGDPDSASRKKKGQRFFCTGYPPCSLSFTRSEHLARHIRKHTGERPFQCHCNRRFSRLDNLRQHAQTVHVNEEIPNDSLAATGTRFQRQIRTDRVRPTGRPRTGTGSSTGSHNRGHSRNLSASSVASTSSNYSMVTEAKRRPPPLLMANDNPNRPNMGIEPPQTPPAQYRGYNPGSPGGLSTPTSANFSNTPGSPGFQSSIGSPASSNARLAGFIGSRPHQRRLSVPSSSQAYQNQYPPGFPTPYMNHMGPPSSHASSNSSVFASPTSGTFSAPGQYIPPGEDWRRRTWHPSSYSGANLNYGRPATSGLTYSQTPDAPQPAHAQHATAAAGQAPRLPGIESFDHVQHRSYTPPRRQPSPMQVDSQSSDPHNSMTGPGPDVRVRPGQVSWDGGRPSQYPELDDHGDKNQRVQSWGQQATNAIHTVGGHAQRHMDMGPPPSGMAMSQGHPSGRDLGDIQSSLAKNKRQAWYGGPGSTTTRVSPEDSSSSDGVPTPGMTAVEVHPMIMPSSGYMEPSHAPLVVDGHQNVCLAPPPYVDSNRHRNPAPFPHHDRGGSDMNRLEALVAVATSGENGAR